jgi:hypothetical protein
MAYQFDEDFQARSGSDPLAVMLKRRTFHQRIVPLPPGRYRLRIVLKDVNANKFGTADTMVWIPQVSDTGLNTSSLIYADVIQPAPESSRGEEFVLGPLKVIPNIKAAFQRRNRLGLYLEVYDLEVDQLTQKPSVDITYALQGPDGNMIQIDKQFESRFEEGRSMAIAKGIPLEGFAPGKYRVVVQVSDKLSQRTCTLEGQVEIL